jgi:hypothetical protein
MVFMVGPGPRFFLTFPKIVTKKVGHVFGCLCGRPSPVLCLRDAGDKQQWDEYE